MFFFFNISIFILVLDTEICSLLYAAEEATSEEKESKEKYMQNAKRLCAQSYFIHDSCQFLGGQTTPQIPPPPMLYVLDRQCFCLTLDQTRHVLEPTGKNE